MIVFYRIFQRIGDMPLPHHIVKLGRSVFSGRNYKIAITHGRKNRNKMR
jgi:hypothetical protein